MAKPDDKHEQARSLAEDALASMRRTTARLRQKAARQGYRLIKSKSRNPRSSGYGGYVLLYRHHEGVAAGLDGEMLYRLSLADVQQFLATPA